MRIHKQVVRAIMAERGISACQLCRMAGWSSPSMLSQVFAAANNQPKTLKRIADALGVRVKRIMIQEDAT